MRIAVFFCALPDFHASPARLFTLSGGTVTYPLAPGARSSFGQARAMPKDFLARVSRDLVAGFSLSPANWARASFF